MGRFGSLGFFDLKGFLYHYSNMRAGCWSNMIPACGLVLVPEGSSSCPCSYNYKTTVALAPTSRNNHWGVYTDTGHQRYGNRRIDHLCLNFGAPGDRADAKGAVWFGYPRHWRTSGLSPRLATLPIEAPDLDADVTAAMWCNPDWTKGTDRPWLLSSALVGPLKLKIRLVPAGGKPTSYSVTLYFHSPDGASDSAQFDVKLEGETDAQVSVALPDGQAYAQNRLVTEKLTVRVAEHLTLEVIPSGNIPPAICGMRIDRTGR